MPTPPLDLHAQGDDGTQHAIQNVPPIPPSGRYLPGAVLSGKYRLDALLGEGGMGAVWRATNLLLELPVAIKLIRADLDRGQLRARLQLEARAAAKLGHPAIVRVFDVGESEFGDPFIVMELLQGETLSSLLTRGRLSGAYAVQLLLPIIDALGTAHARGIVHRDLKPDNLMIALEEQHVQPKILDFGIAKLLDPPPSDHKLTEAGAVVGSPDYMSPEQARGREDLDASTDIWSICVVLYEAVTGMAPFTATNYHALLRAIVEDQPRSIVERAAGDEALWAIILRGLAKDRHDRYQSMTELGQALAAWLLSHGIRDDAAGASVESKWLGHTSDPASLTPRGGEAAAISADYKPRLKQESQPGATGVGRGPFTHTILPHTSHRKRVLGALGAASVLCAAVLALVFGRSWARESSARRPHAQLVSVINAAQPAPLAAAERPEPTAAPSPTTADGVSPVVASAGALDLSPSVISGARPGNAARSVAAPAPRANQPARTVSAPLGASSGAASAKSSAPVPAPASPAKVRDRPLDLLAPY
jgi:serine/threonine protein kinase